MVLLPTTPLSALAHAHPGAARALRRMGLDAQGAPGTTLAQACEEGGHSVLDALRMLEEAVPAWAPRSIPAWEHAPLAEVVDHLLERHHAYTRSEVARLEPLLEQCLQAETPAGLPLDKVHAHFRTFREDIHTHLDLEERTLFPALLRGAADLDGAWDRQVHAEHAAVEELFQNIGTLLSHYEVPEGADPALRSLILGLRDLEEDLHRHIHLENEVLFPRCSLSGPSAG
jgi:regulator of cell morphogenesis and NO signaling